MGSKSVRWAAVALAFLAGCAQPPRASAPPAAQRASAAAEAATVTAHDFTLSVPGGALPAGVVELRLRNEGAEPHQLMVARLRDGVTARDFAAAIERDGDPAVLTTVETFLGGPNGVEPGKSGTATLTLEPGPHVLFCLIPSADGTPHAVKGMVREITVEGAPPQAPTEGLPEADVRIGTYEYGFDLPEALPAGGTALVENVGGETHEVVVFQPLPGRDVDEVRAWVETLRGVPPARMAGGTGFLSRRRSNLITLPARPGSYLLVCFMPTAAGVPHRDHGMTAVVEVR